MTANVNVTVLVENTVALHSLNAEHGWACWLEADGHRLLFDTGANGTTLLHNARVLGVDLGAADAVVLSHGHYDHTGGLGEVMDMTDAPVYMHSAALKPNYASGCRHIGMPAGLPHRLAQNGRVTFTDTVTDIWPGIRLTGEIPRTNSFEDTGGPFFDDCECTQRARLADDQALFMDTPEGTVIILGCAHSGVVNTMQYVHELTDGKPIRSVIGGMHLGSASDTRIEQTVQAFGDFGVACIAAGHCTGLEAIERLWGAFPEAFVEASAGRRLAL